MFNGMDNVGLVLTNFIICGLYQLKIKEAIRRLSSCPILSLPYKSHVCRLHLVHVTSNYIFAQEKRFCVTCDPLATLNLGFVVVVLIVVCGVVPAYFGSHVSLVQVVLVLYHCFSYIYDT